MVEHYIVETMEDVDFDLEGAINTAKVLAAKLGTSIKVYKCVGQAQAVIWVPLG